MNVFAIFVVGLFVTGITLTAVFLVGLSEAGDSAHSRPSDLSNLEKRLVDRPGESEQKTVDDTR